MLPPFGMPGGGMPVPGHAHGWPTAGPPAAPVPSPAAAPTPPPSGYEPPSTEIASTREAPRAADLPTADDIAEQGARQLAAARLRAIGRRAVATVVGVEDTGRVAGGERVFTLTLNVRPEHGEPYRVTHETAVPGAELGNLAEGTHLPVRVDPTDQTQIAMDWHRVD